MSRVSFYIIMAFSRRGSYRNQEGKSLVDMAFKITTGLSSVIIASPFDQTQDEVMDCGKDPSSRTDGHTGMIFMESHIAAIMQTGFDQPMLPPDAEYFRRGSLLSGKA